MADFPNDDGTVEEEWQGLREAVKAAVEETVGFKQRQARNPWFDDDCRKAVKLRNEARLKNLQRETRANKRAFTMARTRASHMCRRKEREYENRKVKGIEEMAEAKNIREMYSRIKEQKRGFQATMVRDKKMEV